MSDSYYDPYDQPQQSENRGAAITGLVAAFIALLCFFLPWSVLRIINPASYFGFGDATISISQSGWQMMTLSSPTVSGLGGLGEMASSLYNQVNMGQTMYQAVDSATRAKLDLARVTLGIILLLVLVALILTLMRVVSHNSTGKVVTTVLGILGIIGAIIVSTTWKTQFNTQSQELDMVLNAVFHVYSGAGFWGALLAFLTLTITSFMLPSTPRPVSTPAYDYQQSSTPPPYTADQGAYPPPYGDYGDPYAQPQTKKSPLGIIIGVILGILLLVVVILLLTRNKTSQTNPTNNNASGPLTELTQPAMDSAATLAADDLPVVAATTPIGNSSLQSTIDQLYQSATLISQPGNGVLVQNTADDLIHAKKIDEAIGNFIVEANFRNPYAASVAAWDFGYMFRDTGWNEQYRLIIDSSKRWFLKLRSGEDSTLVASGKLNNLNLGEGESNSLALLCKGSEGIFVLNNVPIAKLDLSAKQTSGHLYLAISMQNTETIDGAETAYSNVNVYSLP